MSIQIEVVTVWWDNWQCQHGSQHVIPLHDLHEHIPHECNCGCHMNEDGVYVHHSWDGREDFETGKRKVS